MAATEHIIKLKLEFADMPAAARQKSKQAMAEMGKEAVQEVEDKTAQAGGAADLIIENMEDKWSKFDWAHPIMSIKNIWADTMTSMETRFGKLTMGIIGGLGALAIGALKKAIDVQDSLVKTFVQLQDEVYQKGGAAGTGITNFGAKITRAMQDITSLSMEMGAPLTQVTELYTQLAKQRVPTEDLKEMTNLSFLGAKALGANVEQFTGLMAMMKVQGRLSTDQLGPKGMLGGLLRVQAVTGITETEMSGLLTQIAKTTQQMTAWGAKASDIENMAEATAKLTGLFGKLGLGAERAGQIIDKLMDPSMIGENALLVRNMGMSMQEYMKMLQGGAVDQEKLTSGLVRAAQKVADVAKFGNPMAAQQMAMMMGFQNVQEALRLAKEGNSVIKDMNDKSVDFQAKAAEGMSSLKEAWSKLKGTAEGALAKPLSGLMGTLTNLLSAIGKVILEHQADIDKFFKNIGDRLAAIDWKRVGESIGHLFSVFAKGLKILPTLLPILVGALILFKGFKLLGPLFGGGKEGGLFGAAGKGFKSLGEGIKGIGKLLGAAGAMLIIAGAIWVLSEALLNFNNIQWSAMLKGVIALVILAGVMIGIGAIFMALPELAAGALIFGAALIMVAGGMWILAKALNAFDPVKIAALAGMANPSVIAGMLKFGVALLALVTPLALPWVAMGALKLMVLGKALKDLAIGMYVLAKTPPIKDMTLQIQGIASAINTMGQAQFKGNAKEIGEGFKTITDSVMSLAAIDPDKLARLNGAMLEMSAGIGSWLTTMSSKSGRGGIASFLGLAPDLRATADAFKDLAIGVYVFGAAAKLLPDIKNMMDYLPVMMDKVTASLDQFNRVKDVSKTFTNMLAEMRQAAVAPINITAQAQGGVVPVTGNITNLTGGGTADIATSQAQSSDKIVAAIADLKKTFIDAMGDEINQLGVIIKNTGKIQTNTRQAAL